jgi:outer membrane protein OmpA-like peptidoglycan-associated protein
MRYRLTGRGRLVVAALIIIIIAAVSFAAGYLARQSAPSHLGGEPAPSVSLAGEGESGAGDASPAAKEEYDGSGEGMPELLRSSIFFGPDGDTVAGDARKELLRLSRALNSQGGRLLVVLEGSYNGYPDNDGEYFENLAASRAVKVKCELEKMVDGEVRIIARSVGKSRQINGGSSSSELAKNRRVDVTVYVLGE